jgi:propionyl-CoA carboxylase alpha chain
MFFGTVNDVDICAQVERNPVGYKLTHAGGQIDMRVLESHVAEHQRLMLKKPPPDTSKFLLSPMPGLLIRLAIEVGQEVNAGQELAVVEAMKMENILRAERDGVIGEIYASTGDSLLVDQTILEFE